MDHSQITPVAFVLQFALNILICMVTLGIMFVLKSVHLIQIHMQIPQLKHVFSGALMATMLKT